MTEKTENATLVTVTLAPLDEGGHPIAGHASVRIGAGDGEEVFVATANFEQTNSPFPTIKISPVASEVNIRDAQRIGLVICDLCKEIRNLIKIADDGEQ
jgi:hypothetical protein